MLLVAGAGTGKTRTMVERLVQSVLDGKPIQDQVAITFTVKAAHEIQERLRKALAQSPSPSATEALEHLANMRIGTIDKVVQRLLEENNIQAGLAAGFRILSGSELEDHLETWFKERIDAWRKDSTLLDSWRALHQLEQSTKSVGDLLKEIATRVVTGGQPLSVHDGAAETAQRHTDLQAEVDRLRVEAESAPDNLLEPARLHVISLQQNLDLCRQNPFEEHPTPKAMRTLGGAAGKPLRDAIIEAKEQIAKLASAYRYAQIAPLLSAVAADAQSFADDLTKRGLLDFNRALSLAIHILETSEEALAATRNQISSIMIDEFQDTSPSQIRLAKLLSGEEVPWFVVGDPKQSIYRFRGADLDGFIRFQVEAEQGGAQRGLLTSNFRSHRSVLEVVNQVLATEFDASENIGYTPLDPMTPGQDRLVSNAWVVGGSEVNASDVANRESELVVKAIGLAMTQKWQTRTEDGVRPLELSDIVILLRSRSKLTGLTDALTQARIPFRIEGDSDVFGTDEVRALIDVLRTLTRAPATDDPAQTKIAQVAALRSLAIALNLDDLRDPITLEAAIARIEDLRKEVQTSTPYQAAIRVIQAFELESLACQLPRPRAVINRYRAVIDKALAAESEGIYNVRSFVDLLDAEDKRLTESPDPETDESAVRIMTVHASKGLEFPMVLVVGFSSDVPFRDKIVDAGQNQLAIRVGSKGQAEPFIFDALAEANRRASSEELKRLLYVAMTRAEDHLVVSSYHPARSNDLIKRVVGNRNPGAEQLLAEFNLEDWQKPVAKSFEFPDADPLRTAWSSVPQSERRTTPTKLAHADDDDALEASDAVEISEDAVSHRPIAKQSSAFGRAVHLALQSIDLQSPNVEQVSEAAAALYGVDPGRVAAFVTRALQSEPVQQAAKSPAIWREVYAAVNREGASDELLEGIFDLVYQIDDHNLGVIDYKTDQIHNQSEAQARMDHAYQKQGQAYRELLTKATTLQVPRISFIFLTPTPPIVCEVNKPTNPAPPEGESQHLAQVRSPRDQAAHRIRPSKAGRSI